MMLRRMLLAAIGLAAVLCLGGCVVHGHGHNGVQTRTTHNPRVLNVRSSYPHAHRGSGMHSHAGGAQSHNHDKPDRKDRNNPAHHRGFHEDDKRRGKDHQKGHDKRRGKGHDKDRD